MAEPRLFGKLESLEHMCAFVHATISIIYIVRVLLRLLGPSCQIKADSYWLCILGISVVESTHLGMASKCNAVMEIDAEVFRILNSRFRFCDVVTRLWIWDYFACICRWRCQKKRLKKKLNAIVKMLSKLRCDSKAY